MYFYSKCCIEVSFYRYLQVHICSGFQVITISPIIFVKLYDMEYKNGSRLSQTEKQRQRERKHRHNENHALIHFIQVVNSMQFTTLTHLSEVLQKNMVDIKSHSTDKMKTEGRQTKEEKNQILKHNFISTPWSTYYTNYFSFSFSRCTVAVFTG